MMQSMSAEDIAGVQRGMAERPDSVTTLASINVPTLLVAGEEDSIPLSEFELMRQQISDSRLQVISQVGHYAASRSRRNLVRCCEHSLTDFRGARLPPTVPVPGCAIAGLAFRGLSGHLSVTEDLSQLLQDLVTAD